MSAMRGQGAHRHLKEVRRLFAPASSAPASSRTSYRSVWMHALCAGISCVRHLPGQVHHVMAHRYSARNGFQELCNIKVPAAASRQKRRPWDGYLDDEWTTVWNARLPCR